MVRHLLAKGHRPTVYDIAAPARQAMAALGAATAATVADAVRGKSLALSSLPMPADVEAVVAEAAPALRADVVWADLSTIDPATARRIAGTGLRFVDAPVSGGPNGAEAGTLAIMAGGDAAALEIARPALETFSARVFHVGPVGAGAVVKLANQLMVGANTIAAMEAVTFARRAGIDPQTLLDVVSVSTGDSVMLRRSVRDYVQTGDFSPAFALRLLAKDLRLYAAEAASLGTTTPSGTQTLELYEQAMARELGGLDFAAILKLIEP